MGVCMLSKSDFSLWYLGLVPLALVSTIGSISFAFGLCSLRSVRDQLQIDERTKTKLETFVARMTAFSCLVLMPHLTQLVMRFYEGSNTENWEKNYYGENCDDLFVPCLSEEQRRELSAPTAAFIVSKYLILLLPALAPLTWIANGEKTFRNFFFHIERFFLTVILEKTVRSWRHSSRGSTLTSSSCVKSNLYHQSSKGGSSFDDSRTDQSLSDTGIIPCPRELIVNYNQDDTKLLNAV